ncbi:MULTISPECIES: chromosomal replication initiator protein DnaA [Actinomycetota]|uniref:hypothetical protein n=1 Tax=Actinomycetota TaxID=201174 RepID=UPI00064C3DDB|nr:MULTISPECIES: hypothetical protein [Actinomycetota]
MLKYGLVLLLAVAATGAVLFGAASTGCLTSPAVAQTPPPSTEVLDEGEVRKLRKFLDNTDPEKFGKYKKTRGILKRASKKALPTLSRHAITKGGLAGVAAGVWIHNANTLYTAYQDGQPADPIVVDSQLKKVESSGGPYFQKVDNGEVVGAGALLGFDYTYADGVGTITFDYAVQTNQQPWYGNGRMRYLGNSEGVDASATARDQPSQSFSWNITNNDCKGKVSVKDSGDNPGPATVLKTGICSMESVQGQTDIYDMGTQTQTTPAEYTPSEGDFVSSPEKTKRLWDAVKADPEYSPKEQGTEGEKPAPGAYPPEVERQADQHGGVVDVRENPDGSTTYRFADGTEFTTWPDGTEFTRTPDGVETWRYPDGTRRTYDPRTGTETTTYPDGTTQTRQFPDGTPGQETRSPGATPNSEEWRSPTGDPVPEGNRPSEPQPKNAPKPGNPTKQGGSTCSSPREFSFDLPEMEPGSVFPFSLILGLLEIVGSLVSTPEAPTFNLPPFGMVTVPQSFHNVIQVVKNLMGVGLVFGMSLWFYRYITGKG